MLAVTHFNIGENRFTGILPESGFFREVTGFHIYNNRFARSLPVHMLICMRKVEDFHIYTNRFAGALRGAA
eukprot:3170323-Amphidinium_carterae.1